MPNVPGRDIKGVVITGGNPNTVNDAAPSTTEIVANNLVGQLGALHRTADGKKEFMYVKFSSTSTGKAPAANQLLYWVDRANFVVDNNTTANAAVPHDIAGVLLNACTRGNMIWALRKAPSQSIVSTSTIQVKGDVVVGGGTNGDAAVVSSTSTVAPSAGIGGAAWFLGKPMVGLVNSTTTSSISIDTVLDIK
jgi:hypothetical protein